MKQSPRLNFITTIAELGHLLDHKLTIILKDVIGHIK